MATLNDMSTRLYWRLYGNFDYTVAIEYPEFSVNDLTFQGDTEGAKKAFTDQTGDYDFVINLAGVVCCSQILFNFVKRLNDLKLQR